MKRGVLLLVMLCMPFSALAETIHLKDGRHFQGDIVSHNLKKLKFQTKYGMMDVYLKMIKRVEAQDSSYAHIGQILNEVEAMNQKEALEKKLAEELERKRVKFYATTWCPHCQRAEQFMIKNDMVFTKYDIEKNLVAKKEYESYPERGVPLLVIGDKHINGFSEKWLLENYYQDKE